MAYTLKKYHLSDGNTVYYINQVSRVPGEKNKQKQKMIEKYYAFDLVQEGKDPETFVNARFEDYRKGSSKAKTLNYTVNLDEELTLSEEGDLKVVDDSKNLGFIVYSYIYHKLELDEFINNRRRYLDVTYNLNVIIQHLIYSRLLWPASKKNTWEHKEKFFGNTGYELQHVYRALDPLLQWREPLLRYLNEQIKSKYERRNTVIFYDVTNYYFEIDTEDEEEKGLRANGVSKEHRPNPIIQMGLFMDENGIPITYELFRGNTNDSVTFSKAIDESIIDFTKRKKIVVADKGMMSYYNILKIRKDKNGYVISQSIRKSDKETVEFALRDEGWNETIENGEVTYKIKERIIVRKASSYGEVDSSKHTGTYNERQVFIWSKKYADRAKYDRRKTIDKAHETEGTKPREYKDSSYGKLKYLTKKAIVDGEEVNADSYIYEFNKEKQEEDESLDGYYIICTNVLGADKINESYPPEYSWYDECGFFRLNKEVTAQEIAEIYGGLWKIEETFKVSKTGMIHLRPVFHSREDRIRAHFLICFISLVIERLLERQMGWKYSAKRIQEALSSFNATQYPNSNIYQITYYDEVIKEILSTLGINIKKKFLLQGEIRKLIGFSKKKDYEI